MPALFHPNRRDFAMIAAGAATAMLMVPQLVTSAAAQATSEGTGDVFQMLIQDIKGHVQQEEQEAFAEHQQAAGPQVIQTLTRMAEQKRAMVSG